MCVCLNTRERENNEDTSADLDDVVVPVDHHPRGLGAGRLELGKDHRVGVGRRLDQLHVARQHPLNDGLQEERRVVAVLGMLWATTD